MGATRLASILVIPCYNEAQRLPFQAFADFVHAHPDVGLHLVDDGSTDGTPAVLQALVDAAPDRVHVLTLAQNQGKAEAVRQGLLAALQHGPDTVGFWDADLATPLDAWVDFHQALAQSSDLEMVLGARVKLLGRHIDRHRWRHYIGRIAATAASTLLGIPVYDTQCGAKLFRVTPGLPGLFEARFSTRWAFDVELLARWLGAHPTVRGQAVEAHIIELPLHRWDDVPGSKLRPTDFLKTPLDLIRIWWRYRRDLRGA